MLDIDLDLWLFAVRNKHQCFLPLRDSKALERSVYSNASRA